MDSMAFVVSFVVLILMSAYFSAVLIGNNIVNVLLTSLSTAYFLQRLGDKVVIISIIITTIVVLVFGEFTPKSLAKEAPETFAMFSAPILRIVEVILRPVNFLFSYWKKFLSKILKHSIILGAVTRLLF